MFERHFVLFCEPVYVCGVTCGGQMTICSNQFSPSTAWKLPGPKSGTGLQIETLFPAVCRTLGFLTSVCNRSAFHCSVWFWIYQLVYAFISWWLHKLSIVVQQIFQYSSCLKELSIHPFTHSFCGRDVWWGHS